MYDPEVLMAMEAIRSRNAPVIDELDSKVQEQQRKDIAMAKHN